MNWINLHLTSQLEELHTKSVERPQLIFKHSTSCSISSIVKNRLYKNPLPSNIDFYYLDLLSHRNISNNIAERYHIKHESPQVLLIKNGECVFHESHNAIYMDDIIDSAS